MNRKNSPAFLVAAVLVAAALWVGWSPEGISSSIHDSASTETNEADLEAIISRAGELDPLNSLLIYHQDSLLVEHYFRGMSRERRANIKSASKTVLSALVGIAVKEGLVDSLDQPLAALLPEYFDAADSAKNSITFRHALTMRTGLETTSFANYGAWAHSPDWVRFQLDQPLECAPGSCWSYSTGTTHLISVIISRGTGQNLLSFARDRLFSPLGVQLAPWDRDPQGFYLGGNNMALRPVDMLRFGQLYLNGGEWNGEQLISSEWIDQSWGSYARSPWNGNHYGYLWWNRELAGETAFFAWGYGGQFIFVVPRLDLVVVTTASLVNRPSGVNHNRRVYDLLEDFVIPAVRQRGPSFSRAAR